ncbi:MAG: TIGR01777 family oxidoreductase [Anaerolineales bacterium]|nr:TIGR01777 family oxidoreductase [Anaerolineales bacterium]
MKYTISGGTGLIGSKLIRHLAAQGHEIIILSRSPDSVSNLPLHVKPVYWDGKNVSDWVTQLGGTDVVINLAGESIAGKGIIPSPWTDSKKDRILKSRVQVGNTLLEGIRQVDQKPQKFIQASAIGYYGSHGDEILTESSPPGSDFLSRTCTAWESSTKPVVDLGVTHIVVRLGVVLSEKGGALPRLLLPFKLFLGGPLGNGEQWYSWIHIDDVCNAIKFLSEHAHAQGVFNLTAPNPVKNKLFAKAIGKIMSRPAFLPVPGFLMKMVMGEVSTVVLDGQRVVPKRLKQLDYSFQYPELEGSLRDLISDH